MSTVRKVVWATFDVVGFHYWPDAPHEVAYLKHDHRHVFKYRVEVEVQGSDREVEFQILKSCALDHVARTYMKRARHEVGLCIGAKVVYEPGYEFGKRSCEMLAWEMLEYLRGALGVHSVSVEVSEDGECGARVSST